MSDAQAHEQVPPARPVKDRAPSTLAVLAALVRRDLLRDLRKTRAFLLLMAAVLGVSLTMFAWWPDGSMTLSHIAQQAQMMVFMFSFLCLAAACIVLPAYGAMAIVQEREQNTLEMLDLTLMPRWALLVGKLLNALGFYLLLVVAGLPTLSLVFGLVGLDLSVFGKALLVVIPAALSVAMLSILCSTRAQRGIVALILSFLAMLCAMGAWMIPLFWTILAMDELFDIGISLGFIEDVIPVFSPLVTLAFVANGMRASHFLLLSTVYQTAVFGLAFLAAWWMLRRPVEVKVPRRASSRRRPLKRLLDIVFSRVPPFRPIADRANPIYRAEVQWSPLTQPSGRRRLFLLLFIVFAAVVLFFLILFELEPQNDGVMVWVMVNITVVSLLAPIMGANTLTKEQELGNLDMLRMTLLRPRTIVCGKLHAGLRGVEPILMVSILSSLPLLPVIWGIHRGLQILLTGLLTTIVCGVLMVCFSMLASASVKRSTSAVVLGYASSLTYIYLLLPGWWGAVELVRDLARYFGMRFRWDPEPVGEALEGLSPVYAHWDLFDGSHGSWDAAQWVVGMGANLLLCVLLTAAAVWVFNRRQMRAN